MSTVLNLLFFFYIVAKEYNTIKEVVVQAVVFITKGYEKHVNKSNAKRIRRVVKLANDEHMSVKFANKEEQEAWDELCRAFAQGRMDEIKQYEAIKHMNSNELNEDEKDCIDNSDEFKVTVIVGANDNETVVLSNIVKGYNSTPLNLGMLNVDISLDDVDRLFGDKLMFSDKPNDDLQTLFFNANRKRTSKGLSKMDINKSYYAVRTFSKDELFNIENCESVIAEVVDTVEELNVEVIAEVAATELSQEELLDIGVEKGYKLCEIIKSVRELSEKMIDEYSLIGIDKTFYAGGVQ